MIHKILYNESYNNCFNNSTLYNNYFSYIFECFNINLSKNDYIFEYENKGFNTSCIVFFENKFNLFILQFTLYDDYSNYEYNMEVLPKKTITRIETSGICPVKNQTYASFDIKIKFKDRDDINLKLERNFNSEDKRIIKFINNLLCTNSDD